MSTVRKNGKAFDSGDVVVVMLGAEVEEVSEISYSTKQEHQVNHALANDAKSWSAGKISHTASMTISMVDAAAIEKAAGGNLLTIKPFDINVTFTNEYNDIVNDTITAKFQKQGREINGDMGLVYQYDLFVLNISYNNV